MSGGARVQIRSRGGISHPPPRQTWAISGPVSSDGPKGRRGLELGGVTLARSSLHCSRSVPERGLRKLLESNVCPNRARPGRNRPTLAKSGSKDRIRPNSAKASQIGEGFGQNPPLQPGIHQIWADLGPTSAKSTKCGANSTKFGPKSATIGSASAKFGLTSAKVDQD